MKNTFVRAAVMSLAFAGFTASSFATKAPAKAISSVNGFTSSTPFPMCVPSDPSHCGMR